MRAALAVALLPLALAACGGDDADTPGRPPADALDPIPRNWLGSNDIGYALFDAPQKDPQTLGEATCTVDAQLVTTVDTAALDSSDREGLCIVTRERDWLGSMAAFTPSCAGVVAFDLGGTTQRNTVCDRIADPVPVDCGTLSAAASVRVSSAPDEIMGDVLGALDLTVSDPGRPLVTTPATQGEGTALWPAPGDLLLEWDGTDADAIEIVVGQTSGTGPVVRCWAADDGRFAVPERLLAPYRSGTAFVEVAAVNQERDEPDGFAFRASLRKSAAIWLFPG